MSGILTITDLPLWVGADVTLLQGAASDVTVWFRNRLSNPTPIGEWDAW